LWNETPAADRAELDARFEAQLRALDTWATQCPENFAPLHLTAAAERARVLDDAGAGELYERAIAAARSSRFLNIEAIATELAMKYWDTRDPARAAALRQRAIAAYESWGAMRRASVIRAGGS